jgi:1-acyl-sn-glycerol-3-phosphate acyltransferase
LVGPIGVVVAFVPLLAINVLQMLSIVTLPLSRGLFRRINTGFANFIWTYWSHLVEDINGTVVTITGDAVVPGEDAIVFCNHQSMTDIVVLICLARRAKMVGYMKWLAKDVVKYAPGVGWGMLFLDCVFLKRNWADDERNIMRTFSTIVDNKLPVWLVSFPEGTRITPEKLAGAKAFAAKKGLPEPKAVMLPRPKGFAASVIGLRDHVKSVLSVTIKYDSQRFSVWDLISGQTRAFAIDVKRFPIGALPRDEAGLGHWIMEEFQRKDRVFQEMTVPLSKGR